MFAKKLLCGAVRISVAALCVAWGLSQQSVAKEFGPEQAAELLAKTSAADFKCNILSVQQRDQLQLYLAEAEVTLAEKSNLETTRTALKRGKELGAKVACDTTTRKAVQGVYLAAHETLSRGKSVPEGVEIVEDRKPMPPKKMVEAKPIVDQPVAAAEPTPIVQDKPAAPVKKLVEVPKPRKPMVAAKSEIEQKPIMQKPKRVASFATIAAPVKPIKPTKAKTASPEVTASVKPVIKEKKPTADNRMLDQYALMARDYYAELKCRNMSKTQVAAFYGDVLRTHRSAVGSYGGRKVAGVLKKAQAQARSASCG